MTTTRHHITVRADRRTGEWIEGSMEYAGEVDPHEHMKKVDSADVFHTMHYLTHEIAAKLPAGANIDVNSDTDVAVTITRVD